jgi:hypothetical protein
MIIRTMMARTNDTSIHNCCGWIVTETRERLKIHSIALVKPKNAIIIVLNWVFCALL